MHLELEELDDFFRMFEGKEIETPIFIGQMNYATKDAMSVDVIISTRYVDDGEVTIITYKQSVAVVDLPDPSLDRPETKHIFEAQQKRLEELDIKANVKKDEFIKIFKDKKFAVYRGVWTADGS